MFKKREAEIKKQIQLERAAWETDKNILSMNESDDHEISIGYATHSIEDYRELVPLVLGVLDDLLKDCTVFTWLNTPPQQAKTPRLLWPYKTSLHNALPNLAAQYAAEDHPETFFDEKHEALVKTHGANRLLMERFYRIPNCATAFQHTVYGFYTPPIIDPESSYEEIHFNVVHPLADYVITYRNFHVELNIRINPATVSKTAVLRKIQQICENYGKKIVKC